MPRAHHDRLLASGIREIAISLDGVEGNDLPFSHVGARVPEIAACCRREFRDATVWLNPVVVGAGRQFASEHYDWGWIDLPDADFPRRLRQANHQYRRPEMAGMWWKAVTPPEDPCRRVAKRRGWYAGLMCFCAPSLHLEFARAAASSAAMLLLAAALAWGQPLPRLQPEEVIARMEESNDARRDRLASCSGVRVCKAGNTRLNRQGQMTVEYRFDAPAAKVFKVRDSSGSKTIQRMVIEPLMAAEKESGTARRDTDINRRNYAFLYSTFDETLHAYVFHVQPHKPSKFVFRGDIWVDAQSFGVRRIEGEPAKSPSFWVRRTHFVHEYQDFEGFWLPVHHTSDAELRIFGESELSIAYTDYHVTSAASAADGAQ